MSLTLGLVLPTVGGDANTWGTKLNADLTIINTLGGVDVVAVNSAYSAVYTPFPEMVLRVTTSGINIPITLPASALVAGKIYTIKKIDAGLGVVQILSVDGIDNNTEWDLSNQYSFVRVYANGSSYDIIGVG
jgi:hypothetical protein